MNFATLLKLVGEEPVFTTGLLKIPQVKPEQLILQLSRWVSAGRLIQLRRGVYTFPPPYRKAEPHPFLIANALNRASYVSLQSALAWHGLIPEYVAAVTSVTTGRPERLDTELGSFHFRHIKGEGFAGFQKKEVMDRQYAIVATPEKALADLFYFTQGSDQPGYLEELRLQHIEGLDVKALLKWARELGSNKVLRAVQRGWIEPSRMVLT
jgi:predicted transcriptional regulator of viral defense system